MIDSPGAGGPPRFEVGETTTTGDGWHGPRLRGHDERGSTSAPTETLVSSTSYSYNGSGNVTRIDTSLENPPAGHPSFYETVFTYARNEKAVTAISGTTPGSGGNPPTSFARGFRYDAARERYRNNDTWSDYDSDIIHGDYRVDELDGVMEVTELRAYMPGIARVEDIDTAGTPPVRYYHTDMIGTTRFVTTLSGQPTDETVYTAFGEKVCSLPGGDCTNTTDHRYGYAGAYGYQSTINDTTGVADFPFLHVGARYYDPALGRFLQRDPIGILGGDNVYAYVANRPTVAVDPTGSQSYPTNPTPGSGWLPSPGSLPPGSPGWKLTPDGWVPKPVPPPPLPPSALVPVAACAAAAVAGAVAGRAIDNAVGRANGGFSISDGLADILFRWWNNDPDYDPSGGGGSGG